MQFRTTSHFTSLHIGAYMGLMENKMETTIVYWGYIGIMEKKMETTIVMIRRVSG